jgi:hypothetical protein
MLLKDIETNFPYISVVTYGGNEYVGIISNQDAYITSMYIFSALKTDIEKEIFLEMGNTWWWNQIE